MKIATLAAAALLAIGLAASPVAAQPGDRHDNHGDRHSDRGGDRADRGDRHGDGMRGDEHHGDRGGMRHGNHGWNRGHGMAMRHHGWNRGHHYGWRNGRGHHCRVIYRHHRRMRVC